MKKVLFFLFYFFSVGICYPQVTGVKFAPDSTYYKEAYDFWTGPSPVHHYVYTNRFILGDTIIGTKYYQKMFIDNKTVFDTVCKGNRNLIYTDSNKVYLNNKLVRNFNLNAGDTINVYFPGTPSHPAGYYTYTVTIRDSINIGSVWRTQITFSGPAVINVNIKWVEGIGDLNYGFAPLYGTVELCKLLGGNYKLNCFSEFFQNTYGTLCGVSSFCTSTDVYGLNRSNFKVYPNPASYLLNVENEQEDFRNAELEIMTTLGQTVLKKEFKEQIDVSGLQQGCYFIRLNNGNKVYYSKFVKE